MKTSYKKITFSCCLMVVLIILLNNKFPSNSSDDKKYITAFLKEWNIQSTPEQVHQNLDSELAFISRIQDSVISQIKHVQIPHRSFGNVSDYFINRKGLCYDRAVLMEKIFSHYNFSFRHLYVYFGKGSPNPTALDFFKKGLSSHALVEVKTSKGWLTIGTNSNWIGVDKNEKFLTIADIRKESITSSLNLKKSGTIGFVPFWKSGNNFRFVYGIYSRHGDFFSHSNLSTSSLEPGFHLLPDYNIKMFLYNFTR